MAVVTRYFEVLPSIRLAYQLYHNQKHPQRTPLILVQGLSGVKEDWLELLPVVNQDRTVLIFDNRGIGESSIPKEEWSIQDFAGDVLKLAQHVGFTSFHLMGISMGGMISQWAALAAPAGVVRRLILGCTTHGGERAIPPPERFQDNLASQQGAGKLTEQQKKEIVKATMQMNLTDEYPLTHGDRFEFLVNENLRYKRPMRGIMMQVMSIATHNTEDRLKEISCPTLIIHGDQDLVLPYENGLLLAKKIKNSRLLILPAIGHAFWLMDDGLSASVIRKFLAEDDHKQKL